MKPVLLPIYRQVSRNAGLLFKIWCTLPITEATSTKLLNIMQQFVIPLIPSYNWVGFPKFMYRGLPRDSCARQSMGPEAGKILIKKCQRKVKWWIRQSYEPHRANKWLKKMIKISIYNNLQSYTVFYLLTRAPSRIQTTCSDDHLAKKAEALHLIWQWNLIYSVFMWNIKLSIW